MIGLQCGQKFQYQVQLVNIVNFGLKAVNRNWWTRNWTISGQGDSQCWQKGKRKKKKGSSSCRHISGEGTQRQDNFKWLEVHEKGLENSNPDLCDAGAMLHQLSYQANWELVVLRVNHKPVNSSIEKRQKTNNELGAVLVPRMSFNHITLCLFVVALC